MNLIFGTSVGICPTSISINLIRSKHREPLSGALWGLHALGDKVGQTFDHCHHLLLRILGSSIWWLKNIFMRTEILIPRLGAFCNRTNTIFG